MLYSLNFIIQQSLRHRSIPLSLTSAVVSKWGVVVNSNHQGFLIVAISISIPCKYLPKTSQARGKSRWVFHPGKFKGPHCVFVIIVNGSWPHVWPDATCWYFIKYKLPGLVISIPWQRLILRLPLWQHSVQNLLCDCRGSGGISRCQFPIVSAYQVRRERGRNASSSSVSDFSD